MTAGRRRSLHDAAGEAAAFWRACAKRNDRWIDIGPGACEGLDVSLDRALRDLPAHTALLVVGDFFDLSEVPVSLLRAAGRRFDCTALVARDPWRDDLPLSGFVAIADLETGLARRFFIGRRERARFSYSVHARENLVAALLRGAGWRVGTLEEEDGSRAIRYAFGAV